MSKDGKADYKKAKNAYKNKKKQLKMDKEYQELKNDYKKKKKVYKGSKPKKQKDLSKEIDKQSKYYKKKYKTKYKKYTGTKWHDVEYKQAKQHSRISLERKIDRYNHILELVRTVTGLLVLGLQIVVLYKLFS
tara:strand:- start:44 stop:442 length:399 start_codon:yes stop_codon:yes gene_type:complete